MPKQTKPKLVATAGTKPDRLNTAQAAAHVGLSKQYLHQLRFYDDGPPAVKDGGRVFYDVGKLEAWNAARLAKKRNRASGAKAPKATRTRKAA
jgi:hypothetical protein